MTIFRPIAIMASISALDIKGYARSRRPVPPARLAVAMVAVWKMGAQRSRREQLRRLQKCGELVVLQCSVLQSQTDGLGANGPTCIR